MIDEPLVSLIECQRQRRVKERLKQLHRLDADLVHVRSLSDQ